MSSSPDSTSIDNLPGNNINVNIKEEPVQTPVNNTVSNNHNTTRRTTGKNKINATNSSTKRYKPALNGIQNAANQGITNLPSRDIPMNTETITQDEQIQPNYLPNKNKDNYIDEETTYESMIEQNNKKNDNKDRLDIIYEELQVPILVAVLYFLFQLPIVNKKLLYILPYIFKNDGNLSFSGYLTKSFIFGGILYLLLKLSKQLSEL